FFSSRRRHTRFDCDWSSDVCSSDLLDGQGKRRLWVAALDRQSPPREIPNIEGDMPLFGRDGEIFFRAIEGPSAFAYRVGEDGRRSEERRVGKEGRGRRGRCDGRQTV